MAIYYLLLIGIIIIGLLQQIFLPTELAKKCYCVLACVVLTLISALRFMVSTDYYNYWVGFLQTYFLSWQDFSK